MSHHKALAYGNAPCHSSLVLLKAVFSLGSAEKGEAAPISPSLLLTFLLSFFIKYLLISIMDKTLCLELGIQYSEE